MAPVLRPLQASDMESVYQLNRRVEAHDGIPIVTPLEEFEEWLDDPHLVLATDTVGVEVDSALVGYGRIWHRPSGEREERAYLLGAVDPPFRGRGHGRRILAWQIARARELLQHSGLPSFIRTQAYDFEASAIALYKAAGMTPIRYHEELLRPLVDLPTVTTPAGIDIIPWDEIRAEEARLVKNQAFADHWGSTPQDQGSWSHDIHSAGSRLDLSFLALEGSRVVGLCRNAHYPDDREVTGRLDGWIFTLGVLSSHRGRGIASALIAASLRRFAEEGFDHAALGVDSDNPTGAYRLYEKLGFKSFTRSLVHQIEV